MNHDLQIQLIQLQTGYSILRGIDIYYRCLLLTCPCHITIKDLDNVQLRGRSSSGRGNSLLALLTQEEMSPAEPWHQLHQAGRDWDRHDRDV